MRKSLLFLFSFYLAIVSIAQTRDTSIFKNFPNTDSILKQKPLVFYTLVSWCSTNNVDFFAITDSLVSNRSKFFYTLLIDTTLLNNKKYLKEIERQKPDMIIKLNKYYPTCFYMKKEAKWYALDVNKKFNTNEIIMGPSDLYLLKNNAVTFYQPQVEFNQFLKKLKE